MSDLISRQMAIDALNKLKIYRPLDSDRYVISDCLNKIVGLPSADRPQEWIPCSERLPEEEVDVLVSVHFLGLTRHHPNGFNEHIKESWYVEIANHIGGVWCSYSDEYKVDRAKHIVVAWMPLPKPYEEKNN